MVATVKLKPFSEDLPEGLREFIGGLGVLADKVQMENTCECPNCVARRAADKPKNPGS